MGRWNAIRLAGIILMASSVGAVAQSGGTEASDGQDTGVLPLAYNDVGKACSEIWTAGSPNKVTSLAQGEVEGATLVAADFWDTAHEDLADVVQAEDEYEAISPQLTEAYTAAESASLKVGLDYAKIPPKDPVARRQFFSATPEGRTALDLQAKADAALARSKSAQAKSYLMLAKYAMALEVAREVRACADEQIARLEKSKNTPPQSTTVTTGPSPVGIWRYVQGKDGMTLSITGGPKDYEGTVGLDTLGSSASGTLNIHPQSEGIFAGSMTFGSNTSAVKVVVAQDGMTLALTGNGAAGLTFTLQK